MLQDYTSTQNNFRRYMPSVQAVMESSAHSNHPPIPLTSQLGRAVDPVQYQFLLNKIQTQIDSFNALREIGKKFLESSSSSSTTTNSAMK